MRDWKDMRGIDIPGWVIFICFISGAWPIGVVFAILKGINNDYKKQHKYDQSRQSWQWPQKPDSDVRTNGEVDHVAGRVSNYRTPGSSNAGSSTEGPNGTTYHYSYVKKDTSTGGTMPPPFTAASGKSSVPQGNKTTGSSSPMSPPKFVPPVKSNFKRSAATVLLTIATIICLIASFGSFLSSIDSVSVFGLGNSMGEIVQTMMMSSITAVLYLFRQFYKSRDYRVLTYISILRGERYYSISRLADAADVSTSRVIKDLHFMQSKGILPEDTVIDRGLGYVLLTKSARAEAEAESLTGRPAPRPATSEKPKTAAEVAAEMSEHEKILARIRELDEDIDDEEVSVKIRKIEELTRKIFKLVEEKPEMEPQLGSFLSYYLPTTLKLLNSYAYFEEQGVRGENIDAGMKNIEDTLDMLIDGYKAQLDKLFESDTLDVTTDINVLEQMMKADGFTRKSDFETSVQTSEVKAGGAGTTQEIFDGGSAFAVAPDKESE